MHSDDPLAFFITWTVYGSHLQGDERGWRRRRKGNQLPQPRLAKWRRERLKYDVIVLSSEQRAVVEAVCRCHCEHRYWHLWEVNARSSHVHVVVTATGYSGKIVRDQLKANCTRGLRERWSQFRDRVVWTIGGDWEYIIREEDLETVCLYVREAQDRIEYRYADKTGR
jgi:REP element-mobilizing transposase RayT